MLRATRIASRGAGEGAQGAEARQRAARELDDSARAAIEGNYFALRDFLRAVEPGVRRVCRGVMGPDSSDLEDAIQDTLIDVARSLSQFRFECTASYYVTRIAMRRAIAARRRTRERWRQQATLDVDALPAAVTPRGLLASRAELLHRFLDELNEDQATALLLRVMMGHSMEEIAEITGVSVNTVKTRLRLGKGQLRRWFELSGEGRRAGG